jgi:hypothetical protein
MNKINTSAVLSFFTGKSYEKAQSALKTIEESLENGEWVAGSRTVRAALNKTNVTHKFAYAYEAEHGSLLGGGEDRDHNQKMWSLGHVLMFGLFEQLPKHDTVEPKMDHEKPMVDMYTRYKEAFLPVVEAISYLDSVRPKPVITKSGLSPTQQKTLAGFDATDVNMAPMKPVMVVVDGQVQPHFVIEWPEGTRHGTSRFSGFHQCEACGHGIKTGRVPLVLTTPSGPASLRVGKDCAKRLFAIDIKGVLEVKEESAQ